MSAEMHLGNRGFINFLCVHVHRQAQTETFSIENQLFFLFFFLGHSRSSIVTVIQQKEF